MSQCGHPGTIVIVDWTKEKQVSEFMQPWFSVSHSAVLQLRSSGGFDPSQTWNPTNAT